MLKIISGMQTGADQAGLYAAKELGLQTGGWAPKGYLTEDGPQPELGYFFNVVESSSKLYPPRTEMNVVHSDGTLIFGKNTERGTTLTVNLLMKHNKPMFMVSWPTGPIPVDQCHGVFYKWLLDNNIQVLNVAGNRESKNPGIFKACRKFLIDSLSVQ